MEDAVESGCNYLLSCFKDGLCRDFYQLRHGPSAAWTTACVGSTLCEFNKAPEDTLKILLKMQDTDGGWTYNELVPTDADSTLRVIQFLNKIRFDGPELKKAEEFVLSHQKDDGGISTFHADTVKKMGYQGNGWSESHPCVSALAYSVINNPKARNRINTYLKNRLQKGDPRAYWWRTPWYVLYEYGRYMPKQISNDTVELSLCLLLKSKLVIPDQELTSKLLRMQLSDGSFSSSRQFRIPRPRQTIDDITKDEEIIEDKRRIFSTSAAIVAISRQEALLN